MGLDRELLVVDEEMWVHEYMEPAFLCKDILDAAFLFSGIANAEYDLMDIKSLTAPGYCWHFAMFASAVLQEKFPGEYVNQFLQKPDLINHACACMINDEQVVILDTYQIIKSLKELDMNSPRFLGLNDAIHVIIHDKYQYNYEFANLSIPKEELVREANDCGLVLDLVHDFEGIFKDGNIIGERKQFTRVGKKDFIL